MKDDPIMTAFRLDNIAARVALDNLESIENDREELAKLRQEVERLRKENDALRAVKGPRGVRRMERKNIKRSLAAGLK
jgi:hypothetical protein